MNKKDREEVQEMIDFHERFSVSHQSITIIFLITGIFVISMVTIWLVGYSPLFQEEILKNITSGRWECLEYSKNTYNVVAHRCRENGKLIGSFKAENVTESEREEIIENYDCILIESERLTKERCSKQVFVRDVE